MQRLSAVRASRGALLEHDHHGHIAAMCINSTQRCMQTVRASTACGSCGTVTAAAVRLYSIRHFACATWSSGYDQKLGEVQRRWSSHQSPQATSSAPVDADAVNPRDATAAINFGCHGSIQRCDVKAAFNGVMSWQNSNLLEPT
jgi:hypothetical protein